MPIVIVSTIYGFSSEDPAYPATNLLSKCSKKWRCKAPNEPMAYVVLQLDQPRQITGIDLGNEHSAHITVLVGKKGSNDFKEILLASSFMSPQESKNSINPNRVRCFPIVGLIADVATEKWDLIKCVCTQPYNRHVKYGLSFVKLHATELTDKTSIKPLVPQKFIDANASAAKNTFAKFKLREDSPDSDADTSSSLFQRWKQSKPAGESIISAAAAIRDQLAVRTKFNATLKNASPSSSSSPRPPTTDDDDHDDGERIKRLDRNRDALLYNESDDQPSQVLERRLQRDQEAREKKLNDEAKAKEQKLAKAKEKLLAGSSSSSTTTLSRTQDHVSEKFKEFLSADQPTILPSTPSSVAGSSRKRLSSPPPVRTETPSKKKRGGDIKKKKKKKSKPFNSLLNGVVLVISGIQNPVRGHVRDMALAMGAKYKPDWDDSCTHLICAFKNTPKYNQVHGQGKIIKKDWISSCHEQKQKLPWRRYALDPNDQAADDSPAEESDDEGEEEVVSSDDEVQCISKNEVSEIIIDTDDDDDNDPYGSKTSAIINHNQPSGSDTEDEIERVLERKKKLETAKVAATDDDIFDKTTDEDQPPPSATRADSPISPLPEFYKGKIFYLSRNVAAIEEIKLKRFIAVYGGQLSRNAAEADYIISNRSKELDSSFRGEVVRPLWVFECNDLECLLPTKRYKL